MQRNCCCYGTSGREAAPNVLHEQTKDGFPQPVSGCRSRVHAAFMSRAPQNAEGRLLGHSNAAPLRAALPVRLCSSLDGASLLDYFFHHAFLISLRGVINQVTQEWQSFPGTRRYHSKGWSRCSAWCQCVPSSLELKDGSCSESAVRDWAPGRMQHAWLSGK